MGGRSSKPVHIQGHIVGCHSIFFSIFRSWTAAREVSGIEFGTITIQKGFVASDCSIHQHAFKQRQRGKETKADWKEQTE